MARRWNASLKAKLILVTVAAITAVLAAVGVVQYRSERRDLLRALDDAIASTASRLGTSLVAPVWDLSNEQALDVLLPEMALADVDAIVVRGGDGTTFAAVARKDGQASPVADASRIPASEALRAFEIRKDGRVIGTGEIRFGRAGLKTRLRAQLVLTFAQIVIVDACLIGVLLLVFSTLVLRPLGVLAAEASHLGDCVAHGKLRVRADAARVAVEFRPVLEGMNATMDAFLKPIDMTAECVTRISNGDIPEPIAEHLEGDFNVIKDALNRCIAAVAGLVAEMNRMTESQQAGDIDVFVEEDRFDGAFRAMAKGVNDNTRMHVHNLVEGLQVLGRYGQGDFTPVMRPLPGKQVMMNETLDGIRLNLRSVAAEVRSLAGAAVEGKLRARADASRFQGDWRSMVEGVNDTLDAVTRPLDAAAQCVDDISRGAIPPRITAGYQGDFGVIEHNLNTCIDAVNALVTDANALAEAAVSGELSFRADPSRHQGDFRKIVDGVNRALDAMAAPVTEAAGVLDHLAARDLRVRMTGAYRGHHARIKESLNSTAGALHEALSHVADAVEQVSSAAAQIASSSQAVASGASQQASSLEETGASVESSSAMTKRTAESAQHANALALAARSAAGEGAASVEQMQVAMGKIKASAEGTSQIIKDVSDIAFQTNLLALNAAVEAARAGEAGRGFAVVAEEVRSLALRAKEAATRTEELIRQSVKEAGEGERTAGHVARKLSEIVGGIGKVTEIVSEIAATSREQASGIDQVNGAIAEMDRVTQQNAASAEESSSAAAELSGQSEQLAAMVATFKLDRDAAAEALPSPRGGHRNGRVASSSETYPG